MLIDNGSVEIRLAGTASILYPDNYFDKMCTVNTLYFWEHSLNEMKEVCRALKKAANCVLV
ncbi:MAG: hypothetical protein HRT71_01170 [Flavobacteriales bacterium]|nr:hypothetical protein [Flavobacteriales bacterium]